MPSNKLKKADWVFIVLGLASLLKAVIIYAGRLNFAIDCWYHINPYDYAKIIEKPVLLRTSDADHTCEYIGAKRIADRLRKYQVVKLSGVKHENMLCEEFYKAVSEFLKE